MIQKTTNEYHIPVYHTDTVVVAILQVPKMYAFETNALAG